MIFFHPVLLYSTIKAVTICQGSKKKVCKAAKTNMTKIFLLYSGRWKRIWEGK